MCFNKSMQSEYRIGLYIPDYCSLLALGFIQEPFAIANKLLEYEKYSVSIITNDKAPLILNNNVQIKADYAIEQIGDCELLVILSELKPENEISITIRKCLQRLYHQKNTAIMAVNAGTFWLADSGLIDNKKMTTHWLYSDDICEQYESLCITRHLYETDGRITTCAGQTATLDCLLDLLEQQEGRELAATVSEWLCLDRIRSFDEKQRIPLQHTGGDLQPKLAMAIELMEQNLEEPLSTDQIAELVNISRRQLERVFKRYLNHVPAKYYLELRLKKAKQLLHNSNKSIIKIGLCCGFSSGPHFSSAYKHFFLITPRDERTRKINKLTT